MASLSAGRHMALWVVLCRNSWINMMILKHPSELLSISPFFTLRSFVHGCDFPNRFHRLVSTQNWREILHWNVHMWLFPSEVAHLFVTNYIFKLLAAICLLTFGRKCKWERDWGNIESNVWIDKRHKIVFARACVGGSVTFAHFGWQTHRFESPGVCAAECLSHRTAVSVFSALASHKHTHTYIQLLLSDYTLCLVHHVAWVYARPPSWLEFSRPFCSTCCPLVGSLTYFPYFPLRFLENFVFHRCHDTTMMLY